VLYNRIQELPNAKVEVPALARGQPVISLIVIVEIGKPGDLKMGSGSSAGAAPGPGFRVAAVVADDSSVSRRLARSKEAVKS